MTCGPNVRTGLFMVVKMVVMMMFYEWHRGICGLYCWGSWM